MSAPQQLQLLEHNFHQVRLDERRILFHIPTTSLFEMDTLTAAVVDFLGEHGRVPPASVNERLATVFPAEEVGRTLCELRDLGVVGDPSEPMEARPPPRSSNSR